MSIVGMKFIEGDFRGSPHINRLIGVIGQSLQNWFRLLEAILHSHKVLYCRALKVRGAVI